MYMYTNYTQPEVETSSVLMCTCFPAGSEGPAYSSDEECSSLTGVWQTCWRFLWIQSTTSRSWRKCQGTCWMWLGFMYDTDTGINSCSHTQTQDPLCVLSCSVGGSMCTCTLNFSVSVTPKNLQINHVKTCTPPLPSFWSRWSSSSLTLVSVSLTCSTVSKSTRG